MSYLYAGLGIAMLTGIMAIFEMGLSLTGQSLIPVPSDPYFNSAAAAQTDRALLQLLSSSKELNQIGRNLKGSALCTKLLSHLGDLNKDKCSPSVPIDSSKYCSAKGLKQVKDNPVNQWGDACGLTLTPHRILIQPDKKDPATPYQLYSCVLNGKEPDNRCRFEES